MSSGKRRLNLRFGIVLVASIFSAVYGVHALHGFQVDRNTAALKKQAGLADQAGKLFQAFDYYTRYLLIEPRDAEAQNKLSDVLDRMDGSPTVVKNAYLRLEGLLNKAPELIQIRRRSVDLAMKLQRFQDALRHIEQLQKQIGDNAELSFLSGRCHESLEQFTEAANAYITAIKLAEREIPYYVRLINLLATRADQLNLSKIDPSDRKDATAAEISDRFVDLMVEKGEPKYQAYLARAQYRQERDMLDQAGEDVNRALEIAGQESDVLYLAAQLALERCERANRSQKEDEARRQLKLADDYSKLALKLRPSDLRFYLVLAQVERERHDDQKAVQVLRTGLADLDRLLARQTGDKSTQLAVQEQQLLFSLAELLIIQKQKNPREFDADTLREVNELMDRMLARGGRPAIIDYLQGLILVAQNQWADALMKLNAAQPQLVGANNLLRRIDLTSSVCYEQLGNPDAQLVIFRNAVMRDPLWVPGRLGLASALASVNRIDEAIEQYAVLAGYPEAASALVRLMIIKQVLLPEEDRDFSESRRALEATRTVLSQSTESQLFEAEILALEKKFDKAADLLNQARQTHPDEVAIWAASANLEMNRDDMDPKDHVANALRLLDEAQSVVGSHAELELARANLATVMDADGARALLVDIQSRARQFGLDDEVRILRGLPRLYERIGDQPMAFSLWKQIADLLPDDLQVQLALVDIATREGDDEAIKTHIRDVRRLEGRDGPSGDYAEAWSLISEVRRGADPANRLERAYELLTRSEKRRPNWSRPARALGILEDLRNDRDEAFSNYRKAMALGDRSQEVLTRVVEYLFEKRRYEEADAEIRRLTQENPALLSGEMARLAWKVAWQQNEFDRALDVASNVAEDTKGYRDLIWLSNLRYARGLRGEMAEKPLREAFRIAPEEPQPCFALVAYLAREGRATEAEVVIRQAEPKLRPDIAAVTLARCYELIGSLDLAEERFLAALNEKPVDVNRLMLVADFYVRNGNSQKAAAYLDRILDPATRAPKFALAWAKRRQALRIATRGGYDDTNTALELLSQNSVSPEQRTASDLRTEAAILSSRNTPTDWRKAIQLFEEVANRERLTISERMQLEQLYENMGNWPKARDQLNQLVADYPSNPMFLGLYADRLMQRGDIWNAKDWIDQLERLVPGSFRTVALKARLLGLMGQVEKAVPLLKNFVKDLDVLPPERAFVDLVQQGNLNQALQLLENYGSEKQDSDAETTISAARALLEQQQPDKAAEQLSKYLQLKTVRRELHAEIIRAVAVLLEELKQYDDAEEMFRKYVASSDRADPVLSLAGFLARRSKFPEALALFDEAWKTAPLEHVAAAYVPTLRSGHPDAETLSRAEQRLLVVIEQNPNSSVTRMGLATLYELQRKYGDAEAVYRKLIELDRRNAWALNNLAWLLAMQGRNEIEALELVERAIEVIGPRSALLDTKAVVYLSLNNPKKAIEILDSVVKEEPGAVAYFHLAQAHMRANEVKSARDAFDKAKDAGLTEDILHPLELGGYESLVAKLRRSSGK